MFLKPILSQLLDKLLNYQECPKKFVPISIILEDSSNGQEVLALFQLFPVSCQ